MNGFFKSLWILGFVAVSSLHAGPADSVQGLYKAILQHEGTTFYQSANITLRPGNSKRANAYAASVTSTSCAASTIVTSAIVFTK